MGVVAGVIEGEYDYWERMKNSTQEHKITLCIYCQHIKWNFCLNITTKCWIINGQMLSITEVKMCK